MDLLSLSLAGMRDGVGPVLTLYLIAHLGLNPVELSWVIAAAGIAALLSQTPIGFVYDRVPNKSHLIALGAFLMAVSCYSMSFTRSVPILIALQMLVGFSTCLINVGIPAVCVGLTAKEKLAGRLARNEIFAKIGNFSALALTGFLMQKLSFSWVFYIVPILAMPVIWSSLRLPAREIIVLRDPAMPRQTFKSAILKSSRSPRFVLLTILGCLFAFANGAMFFTFEQAFMKSSNASQVGYISASLILTQITITLAMIFFSRLKRFSAYQIFGFSFFLILTRGCILALDFGIYSLMPAQVLDGMIAAILFTIPMRLLVEIDRGNFNVMGGLFGTCVSLGATLSTLFAGYAVRSFGTLPTYLLLAFTALIGLALSYAFRKLFSTPLPPPIDETDSDRIAV